MSKIVLPSALRTPFFSLANAFERVFHPSVVVMGGGSILQALWNHRVSTDIDLFIARENLKDARHVHRSALLPRLFQSLLREGMTIDRMPSPLKPEGVFLSGECGDGTPWSFADTGFVRANMPMFDSVEGTGVRVASLAEIFLGKIAGRASLRVAGRRAGSVIPIRDCYDICVCAALEPTVLQDILDRFPARNRARAIRNVGEAPHDPHRRDPKPVVGPVWAVTFEGVAARIGEAIDTRDVNKIPVARPIGDEAKRKTQPICKP